MMRDLVQASAVFATLLLAGCGHSEVKAPCSASEGYMSLASATDRCGPMRPINSPGEAPDAWMPKAGRDR